jgi:hypothetical protein
MNGRLVRLLPWVLAGLALALMLSSDVVALATGTGDGFGSDLFIWGIAVTFGATGVLIAARQPGNPIGWLFLAAAVSAGVGNTAGAYAQYFVETGDGSPLLGRVAAKYGDVSWMPFILLPATFLLAFFPNGHLVSPRWRPVVWFAAVGLGGGFVVAFLLPGPMEDYPSLTNPWGVDSPLIDPLNGLTLLLIAIGMVGSSASLVVRFRRSRGDERQQMKWLTLAGVVVVVTIVLGFSIYDVVGSAIANAMMMLSVMGLPAAASIAILRYRLYDIDVVINRALVYGSLTALQTLTEGSGLAVAASTLAAAALVRPARGRIQSVVDRRFFRRKYDAAQTLAVFGARLRDQVDLDALRSDLRAVVAETMQPAHVTLWTPPSARGDR